MEYVGRFAPSPTGPLHLGSLLTAVASYLHARQHAGKWLLRIEDIDPPRELPGAAAAILGALEALELEWDEIVCYQSARLDEYRSAAESLLARGLAFRCRCSRSEIRAGNNGSSARYPGTCRDRRLPPGDAAVRVRVAPGVVTFDDELQGPITTDLSAASGDYVVVRRDGLPAYHLAVVVDDAAQGVTHVVRGVDLLEATAAHVHLQAALGVPRPQYCHVPIVVDSLGQKLSKQTGASPVDPDEPGVAARVLRLLGADVPPELRNERPSALWRWAVAGFAFEPLRGLRALRASDAV